MVAPAEITWLVHRDARPALDELRGGDGAWYEAQKTSLRNYLCRYFDGDGGCSVELGNAISPVGAAGRGEKLLKVRWMLPGRGKRGGLRMLLVVECDARRVTIAKAAHRKDDPDFF